MAADEKAVLDLSDTAKVKPGAIFPPALPCPSLSTVTGDLKWIFFYTGSNLISTSCRVHASDTQNILIDSELAPKKKSCKYAEIRLSGSNSCLHNDATVIILLTSGSVITPWDSRKPLFISMYHIYDNAHSNAVIKSRTKHVSTFVFI